jgi:hypothetical protein
MKRSLLILLTFFILINISAFAQYSTFVVDDNGNPATTYPTLAAAIATAQTFAGGPHKIKIMEGSYADVNLSVYNPAKIDEIYGDPLASPGTIKFTSPSGTNNFLTAWNGLTIKNLKLVGYAGSGIIGNGAANLKISNMIIRGASGIGINLTNCTNALVDGIAFSKLDIGFYGNLDTSLTLENSSFDSCGYGTQLYNMYLGNVENLTVTKGNYGIYLDGVSKGVMVQNNSVTGTVYQGIYLNTVGGSQVIYNMLHKCGAYGIYVTNSDILNLNWVKFNCLIDNTGGTSQGYDDQADLWDQNYYSDFVFAQNGGVVTDLNPKKYELTATAGAASYNLNDTITVDFNWTMPVCGALDSVRMAAYGFSVNYNPSLYQYVPNSAKYDQGYFGPAPPALYTGIDDGTAGQLVFAAANFTTPGVNGGRLGYAKFVVKGANTSGLFTFSNDDFRDPANTPLQYNIGTLSLALVDNVAPILVSYVANNPAGDNTYSDGSIAGPGPFLKLLTTVSATDNYALATVEFSYDGAAFAPWYAITGTSYTDPTPQYAGGVASLSEASHTLALRVKDAGGNISNVITYAFKIDRTGPVITSVTLLDADGCAVNANYTNAVGVNVNLVDDGTAAKMELMQGALTGLGIPYVNPTTFTLTGADGSKTVNVQLWDKYNNLGASGSDAITLDRVAPVPAGWSLAGGAAKTNIAIINGTYTAAGSGAVQLAFSENVGDLVCGSTSWQALGSPKVVTLSAGDGVKKVYFATRDNAGNISTPINDQIELDQTGPVLTAYDMRDRTTGGNSCSSDGNISAYYSYTGADATTLQWSYDNITWGNWKTPLNPSPDSAFGSVLAPDGWKLLYIRLVDDITNISNVMVDSIYFDATNPTLATVLAVDAAPTATPDPTFPSVTNSPTFVLKLTGLSADIVALEISQNGGTPVSYPVATGGAANFDYTYTWVGTPTECGWLPITVNAVDCAGNKSGAVAASGSGVYFDIAGPSISAFTGPALTNNLTVSLSITATDNCASYQMRLGEGSLSGVAWVAYNPAPSFILTAGDGDHTVNLEVADYGGNIASSSVVIKVDQAVPSAGTFVIVSPNPLAVLGYTSTLVGNIANITWDADVVKMWIQYADGSNTGEIPVVTPYTLAIPNVPAGPGVKTVNYWFKDGAGNWSPMYSATIDYSNVNPPPPAAAIGMPHGSCILTWQKVPVGQSYVIRYNFQNQYPIYQDSIPPHPGTMGEGILAATGVVDTSYTLAGPPDLNPDIYSFSIWTLSKHGLYSLTPNINATATNYILGDFSPSPDGCIKFGAEFGALAVAYNSVYGDPNFNDSLDIAPTSNSKAWGYPIPDQKIDFEDLVIFALNYDQWHCMATTNQTQRTKLPEKMAASGPLSVTVTVPLLANAGDEIMIPVAVDNYDAVKGYHVVLGYNNNNFELVRIEPGSAYDSKTESFFYHNQKSNRIDVSGIILGTTETFGSTEFFRVVLRAKNTSEVNLDEVQFTFRDRENTNIEASMVVSKTTPLPRDFALSQNYPNPFNPTTNIVMSLPTASDYKLTIFNVLGQVVTSFEGYSEAGYKTILWDASGFSSGIYLYKLEAGTFRSTKKMVLLK